MRRALVLLLAIGSVASLRATVSAAPQTATLVNDPSFALYQDGHFDQAIAGVSASFKSDGDVSNFAKRLDNQSHQPLTAWPQHAAAAFVLEAAAAAIDLEARKPTDVKIRFPDLLAWSRQTFAQSAPTDCERDWHLAAVALLVGPPSDMQSTQVTTASLHPDALLVRELEKERSAFDGRFPDDARLALAWGISREAEVQAWLSSWGASDHVAADRPLPATVPQVVHDWLNDAASAFTVATHDPTTRAEATLRLGLVSMYQGRESDALAAWTSVPTLTASRELGYLAHLFHGRLLEATGHATDAEAEFLEAVHLEPGAQAATVPLAALLFLDANRGETTALIAPLVTAPSAVADPWWTYTDERWSQRVDAMRGSCR